MWEVYSKGKAPWAEYSGIETVLAIANGKRMPIPELCPKVRPASVPVRALAPPVLRIAGAGAALTRPL